MPGYPHPLHCTLRSSAALLAVSNYVANWHALSVGHLTPKMTEALCELRSSHWHTELSTKRTAFVTGESEFLLINCRGWREHLVAGRSPGRNQTLSFDPRDYKKEVEISLVLTSLNHCFCCCVLRKYALLLKCYRLKLGHTHVHSNGIHKAKGRRNPCLSKRHRIRSMPTVDYYLRKELIKL